MQRERKRERKADRQTKPAVIFETEHNFVTLWLGIKPDSNI